MTKALGFLTGILLTAAVFFLMLDGPQHGQADEASPAAMASGDQPMNAMPNATDDVPLDVETGPAIAGVTTKGGVSMDPATAMVGVIKTETVAADSTIPPLRTSTETDSGRHDLSAVQVVADPSATAETQTIEARAEHIDSPAPDQERPRDTGNIDPTRSHLFWSPFRSEWAAKGFAGRLTNATQIAVEVVEVASGQYRAAFNYQDELQRLEHIERIESITGLKLE